ncbi:Histidine-containing phosphotransfer protein 2 [Vitis vinifera]|uniref:Histidine-containing phosphotransfer protein n=1 Tax=Vitis vinifera TaxID=29760 RepID=A0A438HUC8_VITVI|nr:Histidine-containing phosphotransfer protein 2 [Vitis vinifera]
MPFLFFCQGMLDKQFGLVHSLKESNSPFFLAEIIPMFCQNVQTILRDLTQTLYFSIFILMSRQIVLYKEPVNYYDLEEYCIKLKGCTSSIGARRMALACVTLRQASENKNKDGCILALNGIKHEYYNLQSSLDSIVQVMRDTYVCWKGEFSVITLEMQ